MSTVGNAQAMTEAEAQEAAVMEQAHFGFIQTLPAAAVVTDEGVYTDHVDMVRRRSARAASEEEGVEAANDAAAKPHEMPRGRVAVSVENPAAAKNEAVGQPGGQTATNDQTNKGAKK